MDFERLIVRQHRDRLYNYIRDLQKTGVISEEMYEEFINWWREEIENVKIVEDGFNLGKDILHNKESYQLDG